MTGLLSWFDEVAQADIDAMLRDPLLALVKREDTPLPADDYVAIRGDEATPWREIDDAPPLDDEWWDSVGWW